MQLEYEELSELQAEIQSHLQENLRSVLINLNRLGKLSVFLEMIEAPHLLKSGPNYETHPNGRIIVVGQTQVNENDLKKAAKWLRINPERFDFYLKYDRIPDLSHIRYHAGYAAILAGPVPHSIEGKGNYSSAITAWEHDSGYPPVIRMGQNKLKITKSTFQRALQKLLDNGVIAKN